MKVVIDPFDPSCDTTALEKYLKSLDGKVDALLKRIAEIGATAARAAYGSAVPVNVEKIDGGYRIVATGDAVVFLEFGAGTMTDISNRYSSVMPFPVYPGSYSEENNGEFAKYGRWHFGGRTYEYVMPRGGMNAAYEEMMVEIRTAIKEVFG